jgi:phosphoribosylanthranilate isomerase
VTHIVGMVRQSMAPLFALPNRPLLIGVFVNESVNTVGAIMERCGLDLAQLSGDEAAELITIPASPLFGRAYKAIRPQSVEEALLLSFRYTKYIEGFDPAGPGLLLDTPHRQLYGGTGETGDWKVAAEAAVVYPRLMLAGGLNPANVSDAVRQVRPFAVDVAGGVESSPGIKDHTLVKAFIHNAKAG